MPRTKKKLEIDRELEPGVVDILDVRKIPVGRGSCYDAIHKACRIRHAGKIYVIVLYGAYNVFGLIGPEHNGIAVLDETALRVLLDEHGITRQYCTYDGPAPSQISEFDRIVALDDTQFEEFVRNHPRLRT